MALTCKCGSQECTGCMYCQTEVCTVCGLDYSPEDMHDDEICKGCQAVFREPQPEEVTA